MSNKSHWHILTLVCCCCLALASLGLVCNCVGVFYSPMAADLNTGRGAVAMFATISLLCNGFMSTIAGRALKKFPLKLVLGVGVTVNALSAVGIAMSQQIWQLYLMGAVQGVSLSLFSSIPVNLLLNNWFEKNHGMATGVAFCFSGLGGALFSPLFAALIVSIGWRMSYALLGLFIFVVSMPGILFVLKMTPAERNLLPFGATGVSQPKSVQTALSGKTVAIDLTFIMLAAAGMAVAFNTGMSQHLSGFAEHVGLGTAAGATMVSAAMMGNLSSKLLIGIISDLLKPIRTCVLILITVVAAIVAMLIFGGQMLAISLACCFFLGFVYGISSVGMPLVTKYIYGVEQFAVVYPRFSMIVSLGGAFALSIIGFIYDFTHSYNAAFLFCAALLVISCALMVGLSFRRKQ